MKPRTNRADHAATRPAARIRARLAAFVAVALSAWAVASLVGVDPLAATPKPPGPSNGISWQQIEAALVPPAAGAGPIPLAMTGGRGGGIGEGIPTDVDLNPLFRIEILPNRIIRGDDGSNTIFGGAGPDIIYGFAGLDRISGNGGNDLIIGGSGADRLVGNNGADFIRGDAGDDLIDGSNGNDTLFGGIGDDEILALAANDLVDCGPGNDTVNAGLGDDLVLGGSGDDFLWGRWGLDRLEGGHGDDILYGASEMNTLIGGPGRDRFHYDVFDARDNGGVDIIVDFVRGVDWIRVNTAATGTISRAIDGQGRRRTDIHVTDPSGSNVRDIVVMDVWVNRNDVEFY